MEHIFFTVLCCEKTIHLMYAVSLNYTSCAKHWCTNGNTVTNNGEFTLDDSRIAFTGFLETRKISTKFIDVYGAHMKYAHC